MALVATLAALGIMRLSSPLGSLRDLSPAGGEGARVVQFNPKRITYEISGKLASHGTVNYIGADHHPNKVSVTSLPWSHTEETMITASGGDIVAQTDSDSITCRIVINGELRVENSATGEYATVTCVVLAG